MNESIFVSCLEIILFHRKAEFFAHCMRTTGEEVYHIGKQVLTGRFCPNFTDGKSFEKNKNLLFSSRFEMGSDAPRMAARHSNSTIVRNATYWLEEKCQIPALAVVLFCKKELNYKFNDYLFYLILIFYSLRGK